MHSLDFLEQVTEQQESLVQGGREFILLSVPIIGLNTEIQITGAPAFAPIPNGIAAGRFLTQLFPEPIFFTPPTSPVQVGIDFRLSILDPWLNESL